MASESLNFPLQGHQFGGPAARAVALRRDLSEPPGPGDAAGGGRGGSEPSGAAGARAAGEATMPGSQFFWFGFFLRRLG